eukprot:TRINITY_DN37126_c0_g1_i1.p2 TRINITY_DN37126_c0_g1~~TRINITY_DN37126_c0_g1_i1.p2  ORF type:complete len:174 (+),score=30.60 TRINITY_DN37126_c0_g1_i1:33-524(+)
MDATCPWRFRNALTGELIPITAFDGESVSDVRKHIAASLRVWPERIVLMEGDAVLNTNVDDMLYASETMDSWARVITVVIKPVDTELLLNLLEAAAREWCTPQGHGVSVWQEFRKIVGDLEVNENTGVARLRFEYVTRAGGAESCVDMGHAEFDSATGRVSVK